MTDRVPQHPQALRCPHGCTTPMQCLRYNQGGSIPSDCALEHASSNRARDGVDVYHDKMAERERRGQEPGFESYRGPAIPNRVDTQLTGAQERTPTWTSRTEPPGATPNRVEELAETLWRADPMDSAEWDAWPNGVDDPDRYRYMAEQALRWMAT